MICPFCGAEQPDGKRFCQDCGKRIDAQTPVSAVPEPAEPEAAAPASEAVEPNIEPAATPEAPAEPAPEAAEAPAAKTSVYHSVLDQKPGKDSRWATIGTGGWFGILLLMAIPVVNFICVLVWSFGGTRKQVKKSFARATLLWGIITTILAVVSSIMLQQYGGSVVNWLTRLINLL